MQFLRQLQLLDTAPETVFDRFTKLASSICGTPISLITLLDEDGDRQFHKSRYGFKAKEIPLDQSFCYHACSSGTPIMIVENATLDLRFRDNPLVTEEGVRFYAGVPLVFENGESIGALCVLDKEEKQLSKEQESALVLLAEQLQEVLNSRAQINALTDKITRLNARNKELKDFSSHIAHDLKSPLSNINLLLEIIKLRPAVSQDEAALELVEKMRSSIVAQHNLINGALEIRRQTGVLEEKISETSCSELVKFLQDFFSIDAHRIKVHTKDFAIHTRVASLKQCLVNLINNALKYSPHSEPIELFFYRENELYTINVKDYGPGIPLKDQARIFHLFQTLKNSDNDGYTGTGIGLAVVKQIMDGLQGTVQVDSVEGAYTIMKLTFPEPLFE